RERFLEIIKKQTYRLNGIIEDLLTLSRVEQGRDLERSKMDRVSVSNLIRSAIELCTPLAEGRSITIQYQSHPPYEVLANSSLLEQAILNLIDNAVKYSEENSSVIVSCHQTDDFVEILVRDQGSGIEERHLPRLFERFYRVDKGRSRQMGGTGLGLAIVKHIAQAHGGRATVTSIVGEGSTFSIHLPIEH
ncbi:MAG: ATP-binding protein, partial [Bdellovibrionales bacterium]|nr:ATP-binding protein [Bdellovibrionales bacterium]